MACTNNRGPLCYRNSQLFRNIKYNNWLLLVWPIHPRLELLLSRYVRLFPDLEEPDHVTAPRVIDSTGSRSAMTSAFSVSPTSRFAFSGPFQLFSEQGLEVVKNIVAREEHRFGWSFIFTVSTDLSYSKNKNFLLHLQGCQFSKRLKKSSSRLLLCLTFSQVSHHPCLSMFKFTLVCTIQPEVVVSYTLGCKNEWKPSKESYSHHKVVVNGPSLWVSFPVEAVGHSIWQGPSKLLMVMAIKFWPPWQGPSKLPWAAGNVREVNLDCSQWSISQDGVLVLYYL